MGGEINYLNGALVKNEIEMEPAFPRETITVDGSIRSPGLTKLEYATFEILKSTHFYQSINDKDVVSRSIELAKQALKQLAAEYN